MSTDEILYDLYYKKHNYVGANALHQKAKLINNKIKKTDVSDWLKQQKTHQLNNQTVAKKKKYLPIYSEVPHSYQIDLTFLPQFKQQNDSNYVLFTAIGINTRYAYVDFSTNKRMETIVSMMEKFNAEYEINYISGDKGSEFINAKFTSYLRTNDIEYDFYKSDSHKLGLINRFHRTLKERLSRFMNATGNTRWIDVISDVTANYNDTINTGIMSKKPVDVFNSEYLESKIIDKKREKTDKMKQGEIVYVVGDRIRALRQKKHLFDGKMATKYAEQIYVVSVVHKNTIDATDDDGEKHTFKKDRVIKVLDSEQEYVGGTDVKINKAKQINRVERLKQKENLIDAPMSTRTRVNPKKKNQED